ncbi:MAG: 30S ribosomal protein S16 [Phycisphaerae bacterium]|nr:30S ribosomal protein S16 [Phycisphaerae bacterium]
MAVKLRMKRLGNRHRPFYRVTAVDERRQRDGRVIEELGTYDPAGKDEARQAKLNLDRCAYWLSVGAQPSQTVASLMKKKGLKPVPGTPVEDQKLEATTA